MFLLLEVVSHIPGLGAHYHQPRSVMFGRF